MISQDIMRRSEMLWFEDVSAINEPVLSFPIFGRISMRQFFILGVAGMISYGLFSATHGLLSATPISIGAFLTLVKPKVGSTEWMIYSIMKFLLVKCLWHGLLSEIKKPRKKHLASKKFYLPRRLDATPQENKAQIITLSDLSKPFRFKMRISSPTGQPIAGTKSKVFLDGIEIASPTTGSNGELEVSIVAKTEGRKQLAVYVEDKSELAFCSTIVIKSSKKIQP